MTRGLKKFLAEAALGVHSVTNNIQIEVGEMVLFCHAVSREHSHTLERNRYAYVVENYYYRVSDLFQKVDYQQISSTSHLIADRTYTGNR